MAHSGHVGTRAPKQNTTNAFLKHEHDSVNEVMCAPLQQTHAHTAHTEALILTNSFT